jgi:hypothetical protein
MNLYFSLFFLEKKLAENSIVYGGFFQRKSSRPTKKFEKKIKAGEQQVHGS